ncbi:endospore germination permease [Wukongibacter baidiensis]|uniref:GerAB/ArcD/ProY family transporter n=1 Tax=Wukongibacter baidiensis TaxID=1723361 RepID=UPI003D7F4866
MNKEIITDKQSIYLIIMFIVGTATILIRGIEAKQDLWLSIILAVLMTLAVCLVFARLHYLFPHKDLFDILEICFGKLIGKIIGLLYIWFAFHLNALILTYIDFVFTTVTFPETPGIAFNTLCVVIGTYAVKLGIEVLARWGKLFLHILVFIITIFVLLSIPEMKIANIRPTFSSEIGPIIKGAFSAFSFPFAEIVIFTMVFNSFETRKSPYKIYTIGLLISGVLLLILGMAYILVLGINTASTQYFPAHLAASRISIGKLLQRAEAVVIILFSIGTFAKFCICLLATCIGISKIFNFDEYRFIVVPISLLMLNLSYFLHESVMGWLEWGIDIWPPFAFLLQAIFPIIILIVAEIKMRTLKNSLMQKF